MKTVSVDYAARHLELLLLLVEQGETVILTQGDRPVARLVPVQDDNGTEVPSSEVEDALYGD